MYLVGARAHHSLHPPTPAALRDILIRTSSIKEKDMPTDIWTVNGGMTCAAGAGEQGSSAGELTGAFRALHSHW